MDEAKTFTVWDYAVFGACLFVSAAIGITFGIMGKKQNKLRKLILWQIEKCRGLPCLCQ